jgi:hypothetical protein
MSFNTHKKSFSNTKTTKDAWKQMMNNIIAKHAKPNQHTTACSGSCTKPNQHTTACSGSCTKPSASCAGDAKCDDCDDCDCDGTCDCKSKKKMKKPSKPNSETARDDGCFCRKCNTFLPMVEPEGEEMFIEKGEEEVEKISQ